MDDFTPVSALVGGALIGISASIALLVGGRIAGISGIFGNVLLGDGDGWRTSFLGGLLTGGLLLAAVHPAAFGTGAPRTLGVVALGGLLVGAGTRLGNGCTSGHGVCGLSRLSRRSFAAVLTFMATGMVTATALHGLLGGA